ncbi:MAG: gamma-glutamyltransferase [Acidobacteriota bacterium]
MHDGIACSLPLAASGIRDGRPTPERHRRGSACPASARLAAVLLAVLFAASGAAPTMAGAPTLSATGSGGAVAAAVPDATEAGVEILRAGGNAVDAAVATALALAVVHPAAGNLGGGGFALVRVGGEVAALDFRETAPAAARRDMFLDANGKPDPERSLIGALAAGVPGSPAGLYELHRRFGVLPWRRVVLPAIHLAQRGFRVTARLHREIESERELLARFPETMAVWLPHRGVPQVGTLIRLPRLAVALQAYAGKGPPAITTGGAAAAIERASLRSGGILTAADLAGYRPVWREPLRFEAFGWQVAAMPLPSSGGIILAQTCEILARLGWEKLPSHGTERDHLLIETWRRAFADRFLLGDPGTTRATSEQLLNPEWLAARAAGISHERATPSSEILPWHGSLPRERPQTTHLSVVDAAGNAVALTTTLNGAFGCGVLVPELQILLNNEMDDFATAPGTANLYGLVQGEANAVGAGKRMLSSMAPTLAWRQSEVVALGSPGGSRIPTATGQVLLSVIVDGAPLAAAIAAPRIHHQWLPDEVRAEAGALSPAALAELERRGDHIRLAEKIGEVAGVRRLGDGRCDAAADPRGPGAAAVVRPLR